MRRRKEEERGKKAKEAMRTINKQLLQCVTGYHTHCILHDSLSFFFLLSSLSSLSSLFIRELFSLFIFSSSHLIVSLT